MFQPTDVSGLFGWYRASSVTGIANGADFNVWQDDSGSGNILNVQTAGFVFATYHTNVINGYPIVRFPNGGGVYFKTNSTSPSLTTPVSGITIFSVFLTTSYTNNQTICANDAPIGVGNNTAFVQGLNLDSNNPSGFYFQWTGHDIFFNPTKHTITASSTAGTQVCPVNTFIIRNDRFRPTDRVFAFNRYGADIATGIASTDTYSNSILKVGLGQTNSNSYFTGDIAEIALYNRILSDSEVNQVNLYLETKYNLGGVGQVPLFINAVQDSGLYTSRTLYELGGSSGVNSSKTLFIKGLDIYSGSTSLYVGPSITFSGGRTLCIIGSIPNNSGFSLFEHGMDSIQLGKNLYIGAASSIMLSPIIYTIGGLTSLSGVPLYTSGSAGFNSENRTLYTINYSIGFSMPSLFIQGLTQTQSGVSLFQSASFQQFPPHVLYMHGITSGTWNTSLLVNGGLSFTINRNLSIHGVHIKEDPLMYLYIQGKQNPSVTGSTPLYLSGPESISTHGMYKGISLYMNYVGVQSALPLWIQTEAIDTRPSSFMPLYLSVVDQTGTPSYSTTLFVQNSFTETSKNRKLYIKGDGSLPGGLISQNHMPLFLKESGTEPGVSMYNWGANLYMRGVGPTFATTSLFTTNYLIQSGNISTFIAGSLTRTGGVGLYVKGKPEINLNNTMYVRGF